VPRVGIINGGDVAVPHSMRRSPKTNKVTAEACARQFVEKINAGLRRKTHRTQQQQSFLQRAHRSFIGPDEDRNDDGNYGVYKAEQAGPQLQFS